MFSTTVVWLVLASLVSNSGGQRDADIKEQPGDASVKEESGDEADASSQDDQAEQSHKEVKKEEDIDEDQRDTPISEGPRSHTESGAGTALASAEERGLQRRRSHLFQGEPSQ